MVLADGRVIRSLNKMLKNNAGYDWTQLFIGSRALSVSSPASCWDCTRARRPASALCAVDNFEDALNVLRQIDGRYPGRLLVFEAMRREYMDAAIDRSGLTQPFAERHEITLLLEATMERGPESADAFAETLAGFIEAGLVKDAFIAQSGERLQAFLGLS